MLKLQITHEETLTFVVDILKESSCLFKLFVSTVYCTMIVPKILILYRKIHVMFQESINIILYVLEKY